jgi:hypothetical protein
MRLRLGLLFALAMVAGYTASKWLHTFEGVSG